MFWMLADGDDNDADEKHGFAIVNENFTPKKYCLFHLFSVVR